MQSNKNTRGRAIFSKEEDIKEKSLKLYTYLVCHADLRNAPTASGDNVRIFKQRDIILSRVKKVLNMDERTIKKYWHELELGGYIRFCPRGWTENYEESFANRWKIRNKHKDTYYEIPITENMRYRKIPKTTLVELNEIFQINELAMKVYIILINYQEACIDNHKSCKKFTYQDLRDLLGYSKQSTIDRKLEACLCLLEGLNLIKIETSSYINSAGSTIPCFILNQANFYVEYDFKGFETGVEKLIDEPIMKQVIQKNKELYPEAFQ